MIKSLNSLLPSEAIKEFKQIYQNEFGVVLSDSQATEKAFAVMKLVETVLGTKKRGLTEKVEVSK